MTNYIKSALPWAHGHQIKGLTKDVAAILRKQTGCQAALARTQGNQEAACRQPGRLLHNPRLSPKRLIESLAHQVLRQVPRTGTVRVAVDWTPEDDQHLMTVSLVLGRRGVPFFWRAYRQDVLKGRMQRYERAVIRRALQLLFQYVSRARVVLTGDRGFADEPLFAQRQQMRGRFVIRVKGCTKVCYRRQWQKLNRIGFVGNTRQQTLGELLFCEKSPRCWQVHQSRARNKQGEWQTWALVSNFARTVAHAAREYERHFGCEEGFREAKWYLGFKECRIKNIDAWSRLFALFVLALLILILLGTFWLLPGGQLARQLRRRVCSRRRSGCELSLISTMLSLLQEDDSLLAGLLPHIKFNLEAQLANVS
jgi:hypothetical protein